jgi:hypothetical protein
MKPGSAEWRDAVAAWVRETRAAQGLPPHLEDPAVLAELAAAVVASEQERKQRTEPPQS